MRVVHVTADLGAAGGGVSRALLPLAAAQAAAGAEVSVLGTGVSVPSGAPGLGATAYPTRWPARLGRSPGLRSALERQRPDVVHAHGVWLRPLAYAVRAARRAGAPLVLSPHGMLSPWALGRGRWRKWLASRIVHPGAFAAVSCWHAASELEAAELRARLGPVRVCTAPHGVPASRSDGGEARRHYSGALPELAGQRVLLFYSRLHHKKRVRELIRLFATVGAERPGWSLLVVGIPETDGVGSLRTLADRCGVGGRVHVLDGRDRPPPWAVADLLALPSHSENFGLVVLEALAAGVPVITTTATPWAALEDVGAGRCVPWSAFPTALDELLARPAELAAAGERGRRWALATFGWARSARLLLDEYGRLRDALRGPEQAG